MEKQKIVQIAGGLTVGGRPVVYACRFAGAPSGTTFLNISAYQYINEKFSKYCSFIEEGIDIKNKGRALARKGLCSWISTLHHHLHG